MADICPRCKLEVTGPAYHCDCGKATHWSCIRHIGCICMDEARRKEGTLPMDKSNPVQLEINLYEGDGGALASCPALNVQVGVNGSDKGDIALKNLLGLIDSQVRVILNREDAVTPEVFKTAQEISERGYVVVAPGVRLGLAGSEGDSENRL